MADDGKDKEIVIHGFKGFNKDMTCRGFQYEIGKGYETAECDPCKSGFHACENPIDVFSYYSPGESVFCKTEQSGDVKRHDSDSKIASTKIKIGLQLSILDYCKAAFEFVLSKCDVKKTEHATGDRSASSATGYRSASSATGNRSASSATGDQSASSATGDRSASSATGYQSASISIGSFSKSEITKTDEHKSLESVACGLGYSNIARACIGSWIVLTERNYDYQILHIKSAKVDGKKIKADTWYRLENGKFKVAE